MCYYKHMRFPHISPRVYAIAILYVFGTILFHWLLKFDWGILWYAIGAGIGLHLFELTEQFILANNQPPQGLSVPSSLRNNMVQLLVVIVTLFVISSTGSKIGAGIVLLLNLRLLDLQYDEYKKTGQLASWFTSTTAKTSQQWYLYSMGFLFLLETLLFVFI